MASETIITTDSDELPVDAPVEPEPTVVEDIDAPESLEETPKEEPPVEEDDSETNDWESYANEHELPYKSPDELIAAHKAMLAAQSQHREPTPEPQRQAPAQPPAGDKPQSFYNYTPAKALIENWKQQGLIRDDDTGRSYEAVASFVDNAFKPELEKTAQVMSLMASHIEKMNKTIRGMQWAELPEDIRKQVKRGDVEALMNSFDFEDMRSAATHYITKNRPDLLSKLIEKAKEQGVQDGINKKRFRFGQQRSSAPASRPDTSWQKYIASNGEVDQAALNRLPIDARLKVLDQIEKATKPK